MIAPLIYSNNASSIRTMWSVLLQIIVIASLHSSTVLSSNQISENVSWTTNIGVVFPLYTNISLKSYYSTLGTPPTETIQAQIALVYEDNITEDCQLRIQDVTGKVVIYVGQTVPPLGHCNNDPSGRVAAFARVVESYGAVGLVLTAIEKVCLHCCI